MSTEYGRLMLDIEGISLSDEDKLLIENKHVGGLIFFSRNFNCFEQIKDLDACGGKFHCPTSVEVFRIITMR